MTPKETGDSFIQYAEMQNYSTADAINIAKFTVDKIINYTELTIQEDTYWLEVLFYLESL